MPQKRKPKKPSTQKRKARAVATPAGRTPPVPPKREIDLDRIVELRRLGLDKVSEVARAMNIPKQTMLNERHAQDVKEAMERGAVLAKQDALEQYSAAIKGSNGNLTGLLIFKMKQYGWTDRQQQDTSVEIPAGVRERVRELYDKLKAKWKSQGGGGGAV